MDTLTTTVEMWHVVTCRDGSSLRDANQEGDGCACVQAGLVQSPIGLGPRSAYA